MGNKPEKIHEYKTLNKLVTRIRDDLNNHHFVLLFAYNGTGKTRLSMAFKDAGKKITEKIRSILMRLPKTYFIGIMILKAILSVT